MNVGIFNVVKGTCYYGYIYCSGYQGVVISPSDFTLDPGASQQLIAKGVHDDGSQSEVPASSWSTSDSSVASVTSNGQVNGNAAGSATITGTATLAAAGEYYGYNPSCELLQTNSNFAGQSNVAVSCGLDHVSVILDQGGFPGACPSTGIWSRQMGMQVLNQNGNSVNSACLIEELYQNITTNSCGNGQPDPAACQALNGSGPPLNTVGSFLDSMAVSGNLCGSGITQSSGCGFSQTSIWYACSNGSTKIIWTSPRSTLSNSVSVNGSTAGYPAGTVFH